MDLTLSTNPQPCTFTVAIPTHNRRETCVMAVQSALAQTRAPVEVLVIADGCTDGTVEAVRELDDERAIALDLPKGPAYGYGNRNEALRRARGSVVSWLGDDDLYLPDHLERIGQLYDTLEVDLVQASTCKVEADGRLVGRHRSDWGVPQVRELMLGPSRGGANIASISHRPERALRAGGWRDDRPRRADRDLWQRMLRQGVRSALEPTPTVLVFRPHPLPYEQRVALNASYLERLRQPREVTALRANMARAIEQRTVDHYSRSERVAARQARVEARERRKAERGKPRSS